MRISKIVLHGFKSYLEPAEFSGFDPQFNAITGLNGSGKSNILDAICFALGQNAPKSFRVKSLAELVYKKGAGGINYASVVVQFDLAGSPKRPLINGVPAVGDTLTVERKFILHGNVSKITINGANSTLTTLQNMFKSVQLNVLNPHFLIMQGRVTKVLSMRPPEIWSMVEEAAGTSVYRERRLTTLRNLKANEEQIHAVDETMRSSVDPKLAKVVLDETNKKALIGKEAEQKRLNRLYHALSYYNRQKELDGLRREKEEKEQFASEQAASLEELTSRQAELQNDLDALLDKLPGAAKLSKKLEQLTTVARQAKKDATETHSRLVNKQKDLADEEAQLEDARRRIADGGDHITAAERKLTDLQKQRDELNARRSKLEADCLKAEADFMELQTGVASEGGARSIESQLEAFRSEEADLQNSIDLLERKMQDDAKQVKLFEKQHAQLQRQQPNNAGAERYNALNEELQRLQTEAELLPPDSVVSDQRKELQHRIDTLTREHDAAVNQSRQLERQTAQFTFSFTDHRSQPVTVTQSTQMPAAGRGACIAGTIAQLTRVRILREVDGNAATAATNDDNAEDAEQQNTDSFFCCALETTMGGAVHNVVVDKADTAKYLLDRCRLTRRTVFEPLDKIQRRGTITEGQLAAAKRLVGAANIWRAVDLVDCDEQYMPVVEKVVGRVWVCRKLEQANKIAYAEGIGYRAVTLEGETVNPSGELTGGGRAGGRQNLVAVQKLHKIRREIVDKHAEREVVVAELKQLDEKSQQYAAERRHVVDAERQLNEYRLREAAGNKLVELTAQINSVKQAYDQAQVSLTEQRGRLQTVREQISALQQQVDTGGVERELKAAEKLWHDLSRQRVAADKQFEQKEVAVRKQQAALDELTNDIGVNSGTISELEAKISALRTEVSELTANNNAKKQAVKHADANVAEFEQTKRRDAELLNQAQEKLVAAGNKVATCGKLLAETQQRSTEIDSLCAQAHQSLQDMRERSPWIATHAANFGQPGTEFSFQNVTVEQLQTRMNTLAEEIKELELKTDRNDMRDATEAKNRVVDLKRKKERLENDRSKLLELLEALESKKELIMNKTIQKTNVFFGKIFGTLLPNATARLERCDMSENAHQKRAKNAAVNVDGLEIQVEIGGGGRLTSLKELSGGQRSLVALSLILAMLKINPAPIYVLDEIDAALDLSHTRNVGQMISEFFRESQFLIVSLKQGMFTNANVLYEIFFREGTSRFRRIVGGALKAAAGSGNAVEYNEVDEDDAVEAKKVDRQRTKKPKVAATASAAGSKSSAVAALLVSKRNASRKIAAAPRLARIGSEDDDAYITADEDADR